MEKRKENLRKPRHLSNIQRTLKNLGVLPQGKMENIDQSLTRVFVLLRIIKT